MGQRTIGAAILAAGLGGAAVVLLADGGWTALVIAVTTAVTGLLVLRQTGPAGATVAAAADALDDPAFATALDDRGTPTRVARDEVDAVFDHLLDRWRGVQGLRLDDDAAGPPQRLDAAVVELRGDILRAEAYLDALRFHRPGDRRPYDGVVAELEGLLRRVGDPDWGRRARDGG